VGVGTLALFSVTLFKMEGDIIIVPHQTVIQSPTVIVVAIETSPQEHLPTDWRKS
jgi:hypothetical protein